MVGSRDDSSPDFPQKQKRLKMDLNSIFCFVSTVFFCLKYYHSGSVSQFPTDSSTSLQSLRSFSTNGFPPSTRNSTLSPTISHHQSTNSTGSFLSTSSSSTSSSASPPPGAKLPPPPPPIILTNQFPLSGIRSKSGSTSVPKPKTMAVVPAGYFIRWKTYSVTMYSSTLPNYSSTIMISTNLSQLNHRFSSFSGFPPHNLISSSIHHSIYFVYSQAHILPMLGPVDYHRFSVQNSKCIKICPQRFSYPQKSSTNTLPHQAPRPCHNHLP